MLAWAYERRGAHTVWLDVQAHDHRARSLYAASGFSVVETWRNAVAEPDGTASDLVIMVHRPT